MARVTVEDCLGNVKNRFELVILASKRARQLMRGSAEPKVAWENDKPTVVALREIALGYTDFSDAHNADRNLTSTTETPVVAATESETTEVEEAEEEVESEESLASVIAQPVQESDHSEESE